VAAQLIQANRHMNGRTDGYDEVKGAFGDYANAPENSENHFPHRRLHCGPRFGRRVRCLHSLWRWSSGSWEQNCVVSDNDANASEGTGRYPRVSTGFKKT